MADVWLIRGADRETGADRQLEVEADSEGEALRAARAAGLLVEKVERRRAGPRPTPTPPAPQPMAPLPVDALGNEDVAIVPPYESLRRPPTSATPPPLLPAGVKVGDDLPARPPKYGALLVLSRALIIFAWLGYAVCGALLFVFVVGAVAVGALWTPALPGLPPPPAGPRWIAVLVSILAAAFWMTVPLLGCLVIHAFGEALGALRDIARSVYRRT